MFAFIGNIGAWEVLIILLIALIVVGPGKLPDVAKGLGKALFDFKKYTTGIRQDIESAMRYDEPAPKAAKPKLEIPEYQKQQNEAEAQEQAETQNLAQQQAEPQAQADNQTTEAASEEEIKKGLESS